MNNMAKQMDMFDNGGLMDEGGTVDPVSGNDVPPGSNQEEVRDDIPAQLSEGEFVFPADVVRFIGLEKLMMIRQRAKAGLQRMDDMGQMGNSEEAIMPDDLPFSIDDLDMEDDGLEMAQGGVVQAANGTFVQPTPTNPNAGVFYNPAAQATTGVAAAPMQAASAGAAPSIGQAATPVQAASAGQPTMFTNYQLPQAPVPVMTPPDQLPKFLGETVPGVGGVDYTEETYVNEAGQTIKFRRYNDGSLKDSSGNEAVIPEGYTIKSEADKKVTTDPTKVQTATVQDDGDGGDNQDDTTTGTTMSFGGNLNSKNQVENSIRGTVSYRGANYNTGPLGIGGIRDFPDMMNRLRSSGLHQLTGGKAGTPMTFKPGETMIISNLVQSRPGVNNSFQLADIDLEVDADFYNNYISGKTTTGKVELEKVANYVNDNYKGLAPGSVISASQTLSQIELEESRADKAAKVQRAQETGNFDDVINDAIQDAKDYAESAGRSSVTGIDDEAFDAGYGKGTPAAPAPASLGQESIGVGMNEGQTSGASQDSGSYDGQGDNVGESTDPAGSAPDDEAFSLAKGGLAKQMKRSGLASKK